MLRKIILLTAAGLAILFLTGKNSFAEPQSSAYLCELGTAFYNLGKYEDALGEFNKALLIDPVNITAKEYVNKIFKDQFTFVTSQDNSEKAPTANKVKLAKVAKVTQPLLRDSAMDNAMKQVSMKGDLEKPCFQSGMLEDEKFDEKLVKEKVEAKYNVAGINITGELQAALGQESQGNTIWKRANYDLNERNWRMLSHTALNNGFNTYDTRVYDSLDVSLDTDNEEGFNFHSDITVDPWSFTGKSAKTTVTTAFGDTADVELKYWSNTGYTVNETNYSMRNGNTFNIPEMYVKSNSVEAFRVTGGFAPVDTLSVQGIKLYRQFQPVREFWMDYKQDPINFRFFPIAYQDQASVSDDPLAITNHHIWWEDSLWLRRYQAGIFNSGAVPVDFTQGFFNNDLSFLSRDSKGAYLTALRGFFFNYEPQEGSYLTTTVATPKNLWQDYTNVDNLTSATRGRYLATDNFNVGATFTTRTGFNSNDENRQDLQNYVAGIDLGYQLVDGVKASTEVLGSQSFHDMTSSGYATKNRGNAYYFSLITRFPRQDIMDLKYGYDEIKRDKTEDYLTKAKFYAVHMDNGFESDLSSYRNTRNDTFWSRHVTFRKPFDYYYSGLKYPGLKWDEINATRIGDGIDVGRDVLGFRIEAIFKDKFSNLFDVRNVHQGGKFAENVARDELTVKLTDKLTTKGLAIYHRLPRTKGGIDPFIYDDQTGEFIKDLSAVPIADGLNPTLKTGSLGLEYSFFDWLSFNGVYERTNDYSLGYANFPRNVIKNDTQLGGTFFEEDSKYRAIQQFLYNQQWYPQPPYHFYNIFKSGLRIAPIDKLDLYIDYTRNEFEGAGQIADTMNHIGLEATYMLSKSFGTAFKYTYSRWKDPTQIVNGATEMRVSGHSNFFGEFRYLPSKEDEFILQYGEGNTSPIGNITYDPHGGGLTTIDTQHIFRGYYRRTF